MQIKIDGPNRTRVLMNTGPARVLFISYETCVAATLRDGTTVRTEKVWSRTTSKMIGEWRVTDSEKKPQEFFDNLLESL